MTSLDTQTTQGQAEQQQPGDAQASSPLMPGQSPSQGAVPGLPPTGLAMQMQSLNDGYANAQQEALGAQMDTGGPLFMEGANQNNLPNTDYGRSSLKDLAERLAMGYGLRFGRGSLVDTQGQFMQTPDQLAGLQGGAGAQDFSVADIAATMGQVSQQVTQRRYEMQQDKATAALQAATGLMGQRGRGSLAELQANFYQQMAANYTNPNLLPEQQDFSYWIARDKLDEAEAIAGVGGGDKNASGGTTQNREMKTQQTAGDRNSTDTSPTGAGDVVTSGPHAGQRPVYTYDPINQTTTVSWENA